MRTSGTTSGCKFPFSTRRLRLSRYCEVPQGWEVEADVFGLQDDHIVGGLPQRRDRPKFPLGVPQLNTA